MKRKENFEKISIKELKHKIKTFLLKKIIKTTKTKSNYLINQKKKLNKHIIIKSFIFYNKSNNYIIYLFYY